jgi:hypothetical protein
VEVSDLTGTQLDLWVAICGGLQREIRDGYVMRRVAHRAWARYCPSEDWAVAGPIIERERITLNYSPMDDELEPWTASIGDMEDNIRGKTPLIAAMRSYVISEFGMTESGNLNDCFCPYCDSENECEHLLLRLDSIFRELRGGPLADAFRGRWKLIMEENIENDDFDEGEAFGELLEEVALLAEGECYWESDGGPGMSSSYQAYYSKSAEAVKAAVSKWISQSGKD